jgi:FLVCR family MFS transporter 7
MLLASHVHESDDALFEMTPTSKSHSDQDKEESYQKDSGRFVIAIISSLVNAASANMWVTYASVTPSAAAFYATPSTFGINLLSLLFMIVFIPMSPVSSWILDTRGPRDSLVLGGALNALGALLKWISVYTSSPYATLIVGQIFGAIAQPFILNGRFDLCNSRLDY